MAISRLEKEIEKMDKLEREELGKKISESLENLKKRKKSQRTEETVKKLRDEIDETVLTFWDRVMIFILSLFGIITKEQYIDRKRLSIIKSSIKHLSPPIMNVNSKVLYETFGEKLLTIYEVLNAIKTLLDMTIFNENLWAKPPEENTKTCAEYLFEFLTNTNSLYTVSDAKSLLVKHRVVKNALSEVEKEIEKYISSLDSAILTRANRIYSRMYLFKELFSEVDFTRILRYFVEKHTNDIKVIKRTQADMWLTRELEKLANIISEIDITPMMIDVLKSLSKYLSEIIKENTEEYKSYLYINSIINTDKILSIEENIESLHLTEVVCILEEDPYFSPFYVLPERSLSNIYKNVVKEKIRKFILDYLDSQISKRVANFEYTIKCSPEDYPDTIIYSQQTDKILQNYNMPTLLYHVPFRVIYLYFKKVWNAYLKSAINDLVVNGIFKERYIKSTLSSSIPLSDSLYNEINSFVKQSTPGGEIYISLSKVLENPSIVKVESNRRFIEQKISFANNLAMSVIVKFKDGFSQMNKVLEFVLDDYNSLSPEYVLNIKSIKGIYNKAFIETLKNGFMATQEVLEILSSYLS